MTILLGAICFLAGCGFTFAAGFSWIAWLIYDDEKQTTVRIVERDKRMAAFK